MNVFASNQSGASQTWRPKTLRHMYIQCTYTEADHPMGKSGHCPQAPTLGAPRQGAPERSRADFLFLWVSVKIGTLYYILSVLLSDQRRITRWARVGNAHRPPSYEFFFAWVPVKMGDLNHILGDRCTCLPFQIIETYFTRFIRRGAIWTAGAM